MTLSNATHSNTLNGLVLGYKESLVLAILSEDK